MRLQDIGELLSIIGETAAECAVIGAAIACGVIGFIVVMAGFVELSFALVQTVLWVVG